MGEELKKKEFLEAGEVRGAQQVLQEGRGSGTGICHTADFQSLCISHISPKGCFWAGMEKYFSWREPDGHSGFQLQNNLCKIPGNAAFLGWQWRQMQADQAAQDLGRSLC